MGYRSTVIIGIETNRVQAFKELLKEVGYDDSFSEFNKWAEIGIFQTESHLLKWYVGYGAVSKITKFIQDGPDDKNFLVCLGEEGELHSEYGEWYEYVYKVAYLKLDEEGMR